MQAFRDLMLTVNNLRFLFEMRFYLLDDMLAQTSVFWNASFLSSIIFIFKSDFQLQNEMNCNLGQLNNLNWKTMYLSSTQNIKSLLKFLKLSFSL
jgi:hypothetical protein